MKSDQESGRALHDYIESASSVFAIPNADRSGLWSERLAAHVGDLRSLSNAPCGPDVEPIGLPVIPGKMPGNAAIAPRTAGAAACPLSILAQGVANGSIDPVARVERCLEAIDAHEKLNAFRHVDRTGALRKASELRDRQAAGKTLGPLAGVVVAVKECFAVQGMPMTSGTRAIPACVPDENAPVIQRLLDADAIVIGMTTMHELAYGATTDNPHFGRVGHPKDADRIAGGSSGGSAVAVATGMADVALGTDSAGSVRMPAAICGLVGFKPSYDLLPHQGMLPLAWSLDHVGVFASSVRDAGFIVDVMANSSAGLSSASQGGPDTEKFKLFRPTNFFCDVIDPSVLAAFESALGKLESAGFSIRDGRVEGLEMAPAMQFATLCAEATAVHLDRALTQPEGLGDEVRVRLEAGQFVRAVDYIKAQRLRRALRDSLSAPLASSAHVLITPTVLTGACKPAATLEFGGRRLPIHPALTRCTLPFNLTGMPAISVPCGHEAQGFPVGLQIVGQFGQDSLVLKVAEAVEAALKS